MKVLVLGASSKPERYAYMAAERLQAAGHDCYLLGARSGQVGPQTLWTEWPDPETFIPETVTLYMGPEAQKAYHDKLLHCGTKRVIFNPGTENQAFETLLMGQGIEVLRACTLVMLATGTF
ncbi:MAG: CoA-binding protein [Sphingobacteriia bacterium]|nr:CoA-binding protein [Sphingobacteriia bacterium]